MNSEELQLEAGTLIDNKYRIERMLGVGGMGTVYVACQVAIGRTVALKVLHTQYAANKEVVRRFHQEARAAGSIGHDNICEVTDYGLSEECGPYLVMPLLKGVSLAEYMEQGRISLVHMVSIFLQTLDGLIAAHGAGIIHRDLKPDNIFIARMGMQQDFVKLLDFGISKMLQRSVNDNLTVTGLVMGTPRYMSPEQAKGAKEMDQRADVYAVGAMMYEIVTGKEPFTGDNYNAILYNVITAPLTPPRELNELLPSALEAVILKAMAREPDDRYFTADEMRNDLMAVAMEMSPSTEHIVVQGPMGPVLTPVSHAGIAYHTPTGNLVLPSATPVTPLAQPAREHVPAPVPLEAAPLETPSETIHTNEHHGRTWAIALPLAVIFSLLVIGAFVFFLQNNSQPTPPSEALEARAETNIPSVSAEDLPPQETLPKPAPGVPPTNTADPKAKSDNSSVQEPRSALEVDEKPAKKKKIRKSRRSRRKAKDKAKQKNENTGRLGTELIDW